jgi:hypothetical protein
MTYPIAINTLNERSLAFPTKGKLSKTDGTMSEIFRKQSK